MSILGKPDKHGKLGGPAGGPGAHGGAPGENAAGGQVSGGASPRRVAALLRRSRCSRSGLDCCVSSAAHSR